MIPTMLMFLLALALPLRKANYELALAAYKSAINGDLANAKLDNDALVTVGVFESLQKDMNNIWLDYLQAESGELDSVQWETAMYWAMQCPLEYGPGVYTARGIVASKEHYSYNDSYLCQPAGLQFRQGVELPEVNNQYQLLPNPSNGYQMFTAEIPLEEDSQLIYHDVNGKQVALFNLPKGTSIMDLELDLMRGVYFCRIQNANDVLSLGKVIIIED